MNKTILVTNVTCRQFSNRIEQCTLFNTYEHHVHENDRSMWADCGKHECVVRSVDNHNKFIMCHSVACVRSYYITSSDVFGLPVDFVVPPSMRSRYPGKSLPEIIAIRLPFAHAEFEAFAKREDAHRRQEKTNKAVQDSINAEVHRARIRQMIGS